VSRRKEKGRKHDGRSRVSNDVYRKRWNEIFNKKDKCVVITDASFKSRDYDTEDK
tara:strand:- start:1069 stop:1233 length:165 start_codon:yes stop_codon:yes gene_type:complete